MITYPNPTLSDLFDQLGLDSSEDAIQRFINQYQPLAAETHIEDAPFWNDAQKAFLKFEIEEDAEWVEVIDTLNSMLR